MIKNKFIPLSKETTTSSMFSHINYIEKTKTLVVTFRKTGLQYSYSGVSKEMYARLRNAASAGHFFNQYIKPSYQYRHI